MDATIVVPYFNADEVGNLRDADEVSAFDREICKTHPSFARTMTIGDLPGGRGTKVIQGSLDSVHINSDVDLVIVRQIEVGARTREFCVSRGLTPQTEYIRIPKTPVYEQT